jgi:hypothetical protein
MSERDRHTNALGVAKRSEQIETLRRAYEHRPIARAVG